MTLVHGAPGQGKLTLSQYLCTGRRSCRTSSHRHSSGKVELPRFPLRSDLSDHHQWLAGVDIWASPEEVHRRTRTRQPGHLTTIECFIADLMPTPPETAREVFRAAYRSPLTPTALAELWPARPSHRRRRCRPPGR